jgi:hypothetical protein
MRPAVREEAATTMKICLHVSWLAWPWRVGFADVPGPAARAQFSSLFSRGLSDRQEDLGLPEENIR